MANYAPGGFRPVKRADGSPYVGTGRPYYVPSTDSTALFIGDPVLITGDGNTNAVTVGDGSATNGAAGFEAGTLSTVTRATAGDDNRITGIVVRVGTDPNDVHRTPYRKASTEAVVWVEDDPSVIYEISSNGSHTVADVGLNANITGTGGSTVTGVSSVQMDSTVAADASNQLRILAVSRNPQKNDLSAASPSFYVRLNRLTEDPDQVLGIS